MQCLHDLFHVPLLTPSGVDVALHIQSVSEQPPPILVDFHGSLYEVEDILDKKIQNRRCIYLVSWKGYDDNENTWKPIQNLQDCIALVDNFKTKLLHQFVRQIKGG